MRRISRKVALPLLAVAALVSGMTTIAYAAGSVSGTAQLIEGATVLPGQARQFALRVGNTSPGALAVGAQVNYVNVVLPSSSGVTTSPGVTAPAGWTAQVTDRGSLQTVKFQTTSAPITPGSSVTFRFPADVAAPAAGDRTGALRVAISSDGGQTTETASGNPTTVIKVLEVTSLAALAPGGVTDQRASAGQSITYGVAVRNHALEALPVTPALTSSQSGDAVGTVPAASIASGATRTFEFPVTLGTFTGEQRTSTFIGDARSDAADAVDASAGLIVQTPPALALKANSFSPTIVRSGTPLTYDFSVTATKSRIPSLTVADCTLAFADTTASLAAPVEFGANSSARTLSFEPASVTGDEGVYPVRITCTGTDGNDHPAAYELSLDKVVTLDNTAPGVTVKLGIPVGQDAVKSNDELTLTGTVSEAAGLDFVRLRTNLGQIFPCNASGVQTFNCTLKPAFDPGTTEVLAEAQATDTAGNIGAAASAVVDVDLATPELVLARTESAQEVLVKFAEDNVIRGGCNPTQWTVNGHVVSQVLFSNGDACTSPPRPAGQTGPSGAPNNFRVLVLADELDNRDETPVVKYTRSSNAVLGDNVRDGAANLAATAEVTAVPGILPPDPELTDVTRTDTAGSGEREQATRDGAGTKTGSDTYWTNRTGEDLQVGFAGGRAGYKVQVVDGAGHALTEPQEITSDSGGGTIAVPVGSFDDRYVRGIRLINAAGVGAATFFDVVVDRSAPAIKGALADGDQVTVTFTDILAFGSDFANDWYAWEKVTGGREYYPAQRVNTTGSRDERLLTVPFEHHGEFGGVDYLFTSEGSGARRYEDRAGNLLADSLP